MKQFILFCCLVVFSIVNVNAQSICGFDKMHEKRMAADPAYAAKVSATNESIKQYLTAHPSSLQRTNTTYTIPVVVHVVHTGGVLGSTYNPTDAQVTGAINYLNQVYNGTHVSLSGGVGDMGIQFALAQRDPNCNATTGINHVDGSSIPGYAANGVNFVTTGGVDELTVKNFIRWDPTSYYNIWVVDKIDGLDGTTGQYYAGFAYFPGASSLYDGTVMLATQMVSGQKTLPHEIGHAFNLYHPFQGSNLNSQCPANSNCLSDGDQVCDTDPITYNANASNVIDFSCRTGTNTCTGSAYSINTENNFMNYTNCYTLFTAGQKARAQAALALTSRSSLTTSMGATPPYSGSPTCLPKINFELSSGVQTETTTTTVGCRKYTDYTYYMTIANNPTAAATATLAVQAGGTATEGVDFDITTNGSFSSPSKVASFASGAHANTAFTIRVYDDASVESTEYFILSYTVNAGAGNAVAGSGNTTLTISIVDNDATPTIPGTLATATNTPSPYYYLTALPFDATLQKQKSQYIYNASELTAAGLVAGDISSIQLYVATKLSTRGFTNFSIKLVNTNNTSLYISGVSATLLSGLTTVYTAASFTTTGNSWNTFNFNTPFTWDGVSNVGMEICFDNGTANAAAGSDQLYYYSDAASAGKGTAVHQNDINCSGSFSSFFYYNALKPIIKLTYGLAGNAVQTTIASSNSEYLGPYADIYFYDGTGKIMGRIQNLGSFDYGCTQISIDRTGSSSAQFWNNNTSSYLTSKSIKITPANNTTTGNFQVTLYYSNAEVAGWQTATGQTFSSAKMVKVGNGYFIPDVTPAAQHLTDVSYTTGSTGSYGTGSSIIGTFNSSSLSAGLAVGIATPTTTWTGASSSAWALAGNWNNGIPDGSYAAIIPNVVTSPSITANQSVRDLTVNNSASIAVANTFSLQIGGDLTNNGTFTGAGAVTLNGGSPQTISGTGGYVNCTLNNSTGATITTGAGNTQSITGTLTLSAGVLTTNSNLILKSSATGTARIATITSGSVSGNLTQERYIPAKSSRTWSLVASPFIQTISNSWQQQVHITGAGTGGTVCPSLTAHTNGFDATATNAPSLYVYDGTKAIGSRWSSVTGTTAVSLAPGTGYRMNIRGPRSIGCSLLNGSVTTTTAATLSSTGSLSAANKNMGSFSITLLNNGVIGGNDNYLLTGNPYPSQISFSALQTVNNAVINNAYAIYAPGNTVGNYAFWNGFTFTGGNTGLVDATGDIIASGQGFFVQGKTAGSNITLSWTEAMKTANTNNGYFRQLNPNRVRIGFLLTDGSRADEIMVQFAKDGTQTELNNDDILSINTGSQNLKSLKAGEGLAFNTRSMNFISDTVTLDVTSSTDGNFKLSFYDFDQLVQSNHLNIYLIDNYTGTMQLMNETKEYPFNVNTANPATQGIKRFAVVFNKNNPIAVNAAGIKVYPNPVLDQLTIDLPLAGSYSIQLIDMAGKLVLQKDVQGTSKINTSKLASGTYLLEIINSKGEKQVQKIVKQ
jgi:hypothetical protein